MINKKGILIGNVTNLIIAALAAAVFFFFVFQVYTIYVGQESQSAKTLLETLDAKLNALEEGESSEFLVQGFEQKKSEWVFAAWSKNEGESEGKPDKCFGSSCLCVCALSANIDEFSKVLLGPSCQNGGFCKKLDSETILTKYSDGIETNSIRVPTSVSSIKLEKTMEELHIFSDASSPKIPEVIGGGVK